LDEVVEKDGKRKGTPGIFGIIAQSNGDAGACVCWNVPIFYDAGQNIYTA